MLRRLLPTLVGLGLGAVALVAFLALLGRLFFQERADAEADARARARVLERYAERALRQALAGRLAQARPAMERAAQDPLADAQGFFLLVGGERVLPPQPEPGVARSDAAGLLQQLLSGQGLEGERGDDDAPWPRRVRLLGRLQAAVAAGDRTAIEAAVRGFLAERALHRVPVQRDAPLVLAMLRVLEARGDADDALFRIVLRDGLDGATARLEGLQRELLRKRGKLHEDDFRFLCEQVAELGARHGVDGSDFEARCRHRPGPLPTLAAGEPATLWLGRPSWYLETDGRTTAGVVVDPPAALEEVRAAMAQGGLLAADDALRLDADTGPLPADAMRVALESPELSATLRRDDARLRLKLGLLGVAGALAVGIALLAVVAQRRKHRFVELKSDFVSAVTHELRTPLAAMRVMAETLEHRLEGDARAKDYPRRLVAEVDGLSVLVENILSFNRLERGRWVARREPVALSSLEAPLREDAQGYPAARVELAFEGFEGLAVSADPELLRLVLSNLLRNACRYNAQDPVQVRFSARRAGEWLELRVSDNGVGLPPSAWEDVFVEFHRLKDQPGRGGGGSGLGLALCRRILGLHGGTIAVESSSPDGTTFLLRFPLT